METREQPTQEEHVDRLTNVRIGIAVALTALAITPPGAPLGAQSPSVRVTKAAPVRALSNWPGLTLAADKDAYTVVLAVTGGPARTAVQVLSPVDPTRSSSVRKGKRIPVRSLEASELMHLMSNGSRPLILAFASTEPPDLSAFVQQNRWATEVVLDTATASVQDIIGVLTRELYGDTTAVTTTVAEAPSARLLSAEATAFSFVERCAAVSTFHRDTPSSVPSGNVAVSGPLGIISYPDWNWGAGTLISGQSYQIIPARSVGSACIDARMALFPTPTPATPGPPGRPTPVGTPAAAEVKLPAAPDKPVEAIPAHMAPGRVVNPPSPKPPR